MGDSDHDCVIVQKTARAVPNKQNCTNKRIYKTFSPDDFQRKLTNNNVCDWVLQEKTLEKADKVLQRELRYVADKHAPVKVIQNSNGFSSSLSQETKDKYKETVQQVRVMVRTERRVEDMEWFQQE